MPQNLLPNTQDNTLDLRGLVESDLKLIDVQGREFPIAADLPLRTALVLLQHAQAWESGSMTAESFDATVDGMWAILKRRSPSVTRDDVLDGFSVNDMIATISFLSLRLRARAQSPNGAEPVPAQERPQETRKRKHSPSASAPET